MSRSWSASYVSRALCLETCGKGGLGFVVVDNALSLLFERCGAGR